MILKRMICLLTALALCAFLIPACAESEDPLAKFAVRYGRRDEKKIAITVDDSFALDWTWKIRDLFHELGVVGTFFPVGIQLHEEDREEWQKVLDYGNEIGSHNIGHYKMGSSHPWNIISALGRFQQTLDATLGYHYQVHAFRPPFGNISDDSGSARNFRGAVETFGYSHVILWDVSQTEPEAAYRQAANGSIMLYHARMKDYNCLKELIPRLLADGYELVTVSQLLGWGENETGPELYVYNRSDYEKK